MGNTEACEKKEPAVILPRKGNLLPSKFIFFCTIGLFCLFSTLNPNCLFSTNAQCVCHFWWLHCDFLKRPLCSSFSHGPPGPTLLGQESIWSPGPGSSQGRLVQLPEWGVVAKATGQDGALSPRPPYSVLLALFLPSSLESGSRSLPASPPVHREGQRLSEYVDTWGL